MSESAAVAIEPTEPSTSESEAPRSLESLIAEYNSQLAAERSEQSAAEQSHTNRYRGGTGFQHDAEPAEEPSNSADHLGFISDAILNRVGELENELEQHALEGERRELAAAVKRIQRQGVLLGEQEIGDLLITRWNRDADFQRAFAQRDQNRERLNEFVDEIAEALPRQAPDPRRMVSAIRSARGEVRTGGGLHDLPTSGLGGMSDREFALHKAEVFERAARGEFFESNGKLWP